MSSTTHAITYEKKTLPAQAGNIGWGVLIAGLAIAGLSFVTDPLRFKYSSIMLFMFLAGVGICSLFMVAIEYLAGAVWSTPLRRVFEILASTVLFLPLFALPIIPFMHDLYVWTHETDEILARKAAYLNQPFFLVRLAIILGLWIMFYKLFTSRSYKQDETRDQQLTHKNVKLAAVFIPVFGLSITALAIDFLMSLEPHWFSTMFGVNFFAGSLVAALGTITITVILLNENGYLIKGIIGDHYYSLGFGMFAGCVFWTYTAFSQGMLIWYANLPEETPWFLHRWEGSWKVITIALLLVHFIGPLFGLIQRKNKRNPKRMLFMAMWVIFAHMLDLYWIVVPVFQPKGPSLALTEFGFIAIAVGFLIVLVTQQSRQKNLVAIGDPKLQRGLAFRL
jgi:hypothetical protein